MIQRECIVQTLDNADYRKNKNALRAVQASNQVISITVIGVLNEGKTIHFDRSS